MDQDPKPFATNIDGEFLRYAAGERLVTENEYSRKMFIIKRGKARVTKSYMGQRVTLAVLGEGEVFGELSFFDAAPRSASVDALTDIEVIVIDGKKATEQIANLPAWVVPIFKTVFHRFREADQKLTVLQSLNDFQKRVLRIDTIAKSVYLELLRFIRTLELLYSRALQMAGPGCEGKVKFEVLARELEDVLGKRTISLNSFWRTLKENEFLDSSLEEKFGEVRLQLDSLNNLREYLAREVASERYLMLSHSAVAVLRKIVNMVFEEVLPTREGLDDAPASVSVAKMKPEAIPLYAEALEQLQACGVVQEFSETGLTVIPSVAIETFNYQNILKSFDPTLIGQ